MFKNYTSDPLASRYLQRPAHCNSSQIEDVIAKRGLENWVLGGQFVWSIRKNDQEEVIGLFFLDLFENSAEIHFGIARKFWNKGFVTEAGQAITIWIAFTQRINQVSTVCDCEHVASIKVLEKIGFHRVRHLSQHLFLPSMNVQRDCWLYTWDRSRNERT